MQRLKIRSTASKNRASLIRRSATDAIIQPGFVLVEVNRRKLQVVYPGRFRSTGESQTASKLIHEMYQSPTRKAALAAYDEFIASYQAKYPKATECPEKDKEWLFTFYDFPAQHWSHLRTTNPIESTFATVRLRTQRTNGVVRG